LHKHNANTGIDLKAAPHHKYKEVHLSSNFQHTNTRTSRKMYDRTLLVLGSGPGIGVGVASVFGIRGFTHIALVARDAERLKQDQQSVLDAVKESGNTVDVKTWACDLTNYDALNATLKEIEHFGSLECVLYNAARVQGQPPLEESREAIQKDLEVCEAKQSVELWTSH
jgi:NAD(P)-dependent dehydrogenase (short-subunit alcohol dehydrogenase family)